MKINSIVMKTIIYATDCSEQDTAILKYAYELCDQLKASLVLLHVFSVPPIEFSTLRPHSYLSTQIQDEKLDILKAYATKNIKQSGMNTQIRCEVIENMSISEGISSFTTLIAADLLILGMRDELTTREIFAGSMAKALLPIDTPSTPTRKKSANEITLTGNSTIIQNLKVLSSKSPSVATIG
ncbi:hypothetical protein LCGC14_1279990, partial [marine sediment metagenome]